MHWSDKYIGMPYHKHNCAELAALVLRKEFKLNIHYTFDMPDEDNVFAMSAEIKKQMVTYFDKKLEGPLEGAAILMHGRRQLCHIGIATKIKNSWYVLHSINTAKMCIRQKFNTLKKYGLAIEGFYTWQK